MAYLEPPDDYRKFYRVVFRFGGRKYSHTLKPHASTRLGPWSGESKRPFFG